MTRVVLGISPGIRATGLVVMNGQEVYDVRTWQTKHAMLPWIVAQIKKYQVAAIVIKTVPAQHCTDALTMLYDEIRTLARDTGIFLSMLSMEAIRKTLGNRYKNKFELFSSLSLEFLDREFQYSRRTKMRNIKILEALSCAVCAAA